MIQMNDLIDTDDILQYLKNTRIMRDDIYRLSDNDGFNQILFEKEVQSQLIHKSVSKSAQ